MFHTKSSRRCCILAALFWAAGAAVLLAIPASRTLAFQSALPRDSAYLVHLDQVALPIGLRPHAPGPSGPAAALETLLPRFIPESIDRTRWAFALWFGEKIDQEAALDHGFHRDPALAWKLRRIIRRLKQVSLRPRMPVQFRILDTDDPEVIAETSSSTIYFGKAYLNLPPSEDELMFVAAHEIAHVEMDHTFLKAANMTDLQLRDLLHSVKNRIATSILQLDVHALEDNARKTRNEIERARYSRAREREADLWGARIALAAGASPEGIKGTLDYFQIRRERIEIRRGRISPDDTLDTRTLTHPLPLSRLRYLEQALGPEFWKKGPPSIRKIERTRP